MSAQNTSARNPARNLQQVMFSDLFSELDIDPPTGHLASTPATQSLGFQPTKTKVKYYSPDSEWTSSNPDRVAMLPALVRWPVTNPGFMSTDQATWIYSMIDFAFPGLSKSVLDADPNIVTERVIVSAEFVKSKTVGEEPVPGYDEDLPDLVIDPICISAEWQHAIGALTVLLFTLGKAPNEDNFSAFSVNRPKAIADKMGIVIDQTSPMSAARLPGISPFRWFGGYFNMHPMQRQKLVRLLLSWINAPAITSDQTVVTTQIALWKNAGLTHLFIVRDFLKNFNVAVAGVDGLKTEIQIYMQSYRAYKNSKDSEKEYLRVIDGDRAQLGRSRDYIGLLNLARSLAAVIDPKFKLYASGLGESPYKPEFIEMCRKHGFSLPPKYLTDSGETETGGGVVRMQ